MPPRRPRTEGEVEAEVQSFGLTNEGAAAIVRLGNTLKGVRKLQREHAELLALGRRFHPPSPLSQPVWKQADIEDSSQPELEAGIRGLRLEDAHDEHIELPVGFEQFRAICFSLYQLAYSSPFLNRIQVLE